MMTISSAICGWIESLVRTRKPGWLSAERHSTMLPEMRNFSKYHAGIKIAALVFLLTTLAWLECRADFTPTEPEKPIFQLFAAEQIAGDHPKATYDDKKPLLSVFAVRDLQLAKDNKGVLIGMNDGDSRTFSTLTHQYTGGLLILVTPDDSVEVLHITAPIDDGYLGFRHPQEDAIATYLRKRFKLGEFKEIPKRP